MFECDRNIENKKSPSIGENLHFFMRRMSWRQNFPSYRDGCSPPERCRKFKGKKLAEKGPKKPNYFIVWLCDVPRPLKQHQPQRDAFDGSIKSFLITPQFALSRILVYSIKSMPLTSYSHWIDVLVSLKVQEEIDVFPQAWNEAMKCSIRWEGKPSYVTRQTKALDWCISTSHWNVSFEYKRESFSMRRHVEIV